MTKAGARDEIIRCGQDPAYFINKYVKIRHPVRGLIPFALFEYQLRTLDSFRRNRFNIVLKPRQMGFTEITSAFIVWLMLFRRDQSIMCLSTKSETAKNVVRRVRTALKNLPKWLLIADITTDNKTSLELANGSWVKSIAKSQDAGRSEALSLLVIDEAAHIEGFDEIWTGIKPTVSAGGRIIMLSTPNGVGNVFHRIYSDAEGGRSDFAHLQVNWWEHPEHISDLTIDPKTGKHTSSWFRKETKDMSLREIAQEYECAFLASGDTFFTPDIIETVRALADDSNAEDGLHIYVEPVQGKTYILSADSATGDGRDNSGFHVFEVESMEQVAEFRGKVHVDGYGGQVCELGRRYNNAILVIENNAVGLAVLEHVKLNGYPNLFYTRRGAKAGMKLGEVGSAVPGSMTSDYIPGVMTTGANRQVMLNKLEELLRKGSLTFHSQRFVAELETFIWNNRKPEARPGKTDDLIMAAALGVWIRDNHFGGVYGSVDLTKAMIGAMKFSRTDNTQVQGASKNPDHVPSRGLGVFNTPKNPYLMRLPDGKYIDMGAMVGMFAPRKG